MSPRPFFGFHHYDYADRVLVCKHVECGVAGSFCFLYGTCRYNPALESTVISLYSRTNDDTFDLQYTCRKSCYYKPYIVFALLASNRLGTSRQLVGILGGCPFNGPLSGTKYPTRAVSPIQNASTPKSSLPFSKHRSCALLCTVVRRF